MRLLRQISTALRFGAAVWRAHFDKRPLSGRDWLHYWTPIALDTLRIDVQTSGDIPSSGVLVANHLSYLDIFVLSSITPCTFVSKSDVAKWPVAGALTTRAGTIYVRRENRSHVGSVNELIAERLRADELIIFFPEGTSTDGSKVLNFHSSLFEAGIAGAQPIHVAHISYMAEDADPANDVCYWGDMTLATHMWNLFGIKRVQARVKFGEAAVYPDRKSAAQATREQIVALSAEFASQPATSPKGGPC